MCSSTLQVPETGRDSHGFFLFYKKSETRAGMPRSIATPDPRVDERYLPALTAMGMAGPPAPFGN